MDLSSVCSSWSRGPDDILTMFNTSWNSPTLQAPNVHLCPAGLFHILLFLALYFWDYPQIWRQANRLSQRKACFVFNQAIYSCSSQLTGRYTLLYIIHTNTPSLYRTIIRHRTLLWAPVDGGGRELITNNDYWQYFHLLSLTGRKQEEINQVLSHYKPIAVITAVSMPGCLGRREHWEFSSLSWEERTLRVQFSVIGIPSWASRQWGACSE